MSHAIEQLTITLGKGLTARGWKLITAESCTGGGLAYWITNIAGSSTWFERGLITYSNVAKEELLGVRPLTLSSFGAVSEQTAHEMAEGALLKSHANLAFAITGIAGPTGGTPEKPVGTVWFAWAGHHLETQTYCEIFSGTRTQIREQAITTALKKLVANVSCAN